jgi:uncharacterized surface protein with fasciclin (FAS1) repeats
MKSLMKTLAFALSIAAFSGASLNAAGLVETAVPDGMTPEGNPVNGKEKNIVETAVSAGSFKTLTAALTAAGLVDTLKGNGPFTVFAPTDEAFAKLPPGTVDNLLKPENKAMLIDILTYHVVSGNVPSGTAIKLTEAAALNNKKIKLEAKEGTLFLNTAKVTTADVKCSNGVIHIIDAVLMPPATEVYLSESPLPQGWPAPGPYNQVTKKEYPASRAAYSSGSSPNVGFWTLFQHIKRNDIPMTSPVEMKMKEDPENGMAMEQMGFLYQSPEVGKAGADGEAVIVRDVPATTVLGYTWQGPRDGAEIAKARAAIAVVLAEKQLVSTGYRLLGYNSPMVPSKKQTYELQALLK